MMFSEILVSPLHLMLELGLILSLYMVFIEYMSCH